jgi:hypothetical protein
MFFFVENQMELKKTAPGSSRNKIVCPNLILIEELPAKRQAKAS